MKTAAIVAEFMKGCSCGPPGECDECTAGFVTAVITEEKRMAGQSNLPPGCTSPDGGLDHEFEQALEAFADICDGPAHIKIACAVMPVIWDAVHDAYKVGHCDGLAEAVAIVASKRSP